MQFHYVVCSSQYVVHSMQYIVCSAQYVVHSRQYVVAQYLVCSRQYVVPSMLFISKNAYQILYTTYYILPTRHYILPTTYYVLPTRYYILCTSYYILCTAYYIVKLHSMLTVFTILGTSHYLLDYPNLHDTYNEILQIHGDKIQIKFLFKFLQIDVPYVANYAKFRQNISPRLKLFFFQPISPFYLVVYILHCPWSLQIHWHKIQIKIKV